MKASSERCRAPCLDQVRRRVGCQNAAGIHQRDAVAAFGFVHEMRGYEDGHALIARKIDQQLPEPIPGQRINARRRLIEDEHLRPVHNGNSERKPLPNAQRQVRGKFVEIVA